MRNPILFFLASFIILFACTREKLNLMGAQFFDVEQLLESRNCKTKCEEEADCEGQNVKLIGLLEESNYVPSEYKFFLLDQYDDRTEIEIRVDTMLLSQVFAKINGEDESRVRLQGNLGGYDSNPGGSTCVREFFVQISDPSTIEIID